MALDTSLNGLRASIVTSLYGRRLGLSYGNSSDQGDYIVGVKDIRVQVEGVSSAGSTITSTSPATGTNLSPWGVSIVGATGASASTAYNLLAPIPGVRKLIFNLTSGYSVIETTAVGGAFFSSTANATSTMGTITFAGKGNWAELIGLTTALWGLLTQNGSSITTNYTVL